MNKQRKQLILLLLCIVGVLIYFSYTSYEGFSTDNSVTVVSAYYQFSSKHTNDKYKLWIRNFLENCPCHLVFFTDTTSQKFIEESRSKYANRTKIVVLPIEEWESSRILTNLEWDEQHRKDPEINIHAVNLYKVWFEKKNFVLKAIEMNPFQHDYFLWTDAGIVRDDASLNYIQTYPNISKLDTNKIALLNIAPFVEDDMNDYSFQGKDRLGGGIIGANSNMWNLFDEKYNRIFLKNARSGHFVGKDQSIMARMYLEDKDIFQLIRPERSDISEWMYLLKYLSSK